ncbi:MAG: hypothetical protein AAFP19_05205 [Bacteroidota bacterium]
MAKKKQSAKNNPSKQVAPQAAPNASKTDQVLAPSPHFGWHFWKSNGIAAALLFLLSFVLYIATLNFEYVLDDQMVLTDNQFVKKGFSGIAEIMTTESFTGYFGEQKDLVVGARYRPLSIATFAIEHQFFGENSSLSHFINIALYGLTGLLIFRLISLFFPIREEDQWYMTIPFLTALLFILHPVHSEVVANVKGRDEILSLIGALISMYCAFRYLYSDRAYWLLASAIAFFLGLLAKENALTFLAVLPLSMYFFSKATWSKIAWSTLPLLLASLLYLYVRYRIIGYFLSNGTEITDIMNNPFYGLSVGEKFATVFYTLGLYIKLLFFPHPLTHDYYPYHIPIMDWGQVGSIFSLLLNVALGGLGLWGLLKKRVWAFGILFYFITLSIVSNIPFTVGTFMNERFIYIPSLGFCLIMAWLLAKKIPELVGESQNLLSAGLLGLFVLGFAGKTISRVPDWKNALSLNQAAIKVSKGSARANCFMGTALFEEYRKETDPKLKNELLDQINFYINRSLQINPSYGSAMTMKSGIVAENYKRDQDLDKLLAEFTKLLRLNPNLSFIDEYIVYLTDRADPQKLADFCYENGVYFARELKSPNLSLKYLQKYGLQVAPNDRRLNEAVGEIYQRLGKEEEAQYYLQKAQ